MKKDISIIFLGNPDFAVSSLEALLQEGYKIPLVVTNPDRPAGRKLKLRSSPVKEFAQLHHLNVAQPLNLKAPTFINRVRKLNPDIMVVIAFKKLPQELWSLPKLETLNIHPSLLPDYRGAAPINWAIINGEKETGVSIISINDVMDAGDILKQEKIILTDNMNAGDLYEKAKYLGKTLLIEVIKEIILGCSKSIAQSKLVSTKKAPKINTQGCQLDFNLPVRQVYNKVRGLSPYPTAFTTLKGKYVKIFDADFRILEEQDTSEIGSVISDHKSYLKIRCTNGYLYIRNLQMENKKRMPINEFLLGWKD